MTLDTRDPVTVRAHLERYYDTVPRSVTRAEDHGPLTLFVRTGAGFDYYARPTLEHPGPVTADDVVRVRARQRELGVPEAFEWVAETTPSLEAAARAAGLHVHAHPLMALLAPATATPDVTAGVTVRLLGANDPALASAVAVAQLGFAEPGTAVGAAGEQRLATRTASAVLDGSVTRTADRVRAGITVLAAAVRDGLALCSGAHNPVGPTTEIVGVATLPAARRQGLALAVTAALVDDARARGVATVFLSAGDDDVARVYARLGFVRVGTALIAEAPAR